MEKRNYFSLLKMPLTENLKLPSLTPQSAMFSFSDVDQYIFLVLSLFLLLSKSILIIFQEKPIQYTLVCEIF